MPFTIPGKWKWTVIGSVVNLISGRDLEKNQILENDLGVPYITGASQIQDQVIIVNRWTNSPSVFSELGDVLLTCKGTVGKITINNIGKVHIARQIMSLRPCKEIDKKYLAYYLMSIVKFLINHAKSMIPGIDRKTVLGMSIPVPPFAEQHRIVSKLNQVFDQIDHAEKAYNELSGPLSERFRQLCLEKAIQGKLVPQLESEPEIEQVGDAPEDVPFAIPEKWKWVNLHSTLKAISDGSHNPPPNVGHGVPVLSAKNVINGIIDTNSVTRWTTEEQWSIEDKKIHIQSGDVLLTIVGTIGRTAVVPNDCEKFMLQRSVCVMKPKECVNPEFLALILNSPSLFEWIMDHASGTAQKGIYLKTVKQIPIPLPPIEEQRRIVAKLNELLGSISQLEQTISTP